MSKNQHSKRSLLLFVFILIAVPLACTPSPGDGQSEEGNAVLTQVAQTLTAQAEEEEPAEPEEVTETPAPTDTPQPTPTFTPEPTDAPTPPDVVYQGICFSFDDSWIDAVSMEQVSGNLDPQAVWKYPDHVKFVFGNYPLTNTYHEPQILVYPANDFRNANDMAANHLNNLWDTISNQPADPQLYIAHFFNAGQWLASQEAYLDFQNGSGVRYVTQYGQAAVPIGYPEMFYTYQGLTDDNAHYVSVIMPVSHPSLPDTSSVTVDQAFSNNWDTYRQDIENQLDAQTPGSFVPSLLELDALVQTLHIASNCGSGSP